MRFTIKHAMVLALCVLSVCVVTMGTVVAVSVGGRNAEASTGHVTFRFQITDRAGLEPDQMGSIMWNIGSVANQMIFVSTAETPVFEYTLPVGVPLVFSSDFVRLNNINAMTVNRNRNIGDASFLSAIQARNAGMVGSFLREGGGSSVFMGGNGYVIGTRPGTVTLNFDHHTIWAPFNWIGQDVDVPHTITRHNSAGVVLDTITRSNDWFPVVNAAGTASQIGRPAAVATNFRGWSYRAGGPLLWPVGLPMPVFSEMDIFAVNS